MHEGSDDHGDGDRIGCGDIGCFLQPIVVDCRINTLCAKYVGALLHGTMPRIAPLAITQSTSLHNESACGHHQGANCHRARDQP